jgi:hypothetical protein
MFVSRRTLPHAVAVSSLRTVPTSFNSQLLFLSDRLQQLKDELASENTTDVERKHLERQILITERALRHTLEEENERRRT